MIHSLVQHLDKVIALGKVSVVSVHLKAPLHQVRSMSVSAQEMQMCMVVPGLKGATAMGLADK